MKYNVMVTSLYGGANRKHIEYYYASDGSRRLYCGAMLSAEASSKYILANHHIDEIITLGSNTTFDPGDDMVQIVLREGSSFYDSDPDNLSTYSLLRYRLAQYIDEISIERQGSQRSSQQRGAGEGKGLHKSLLQGQSSVSGRPQVQQVL